VTEASNAGVDEVRASVSFSLAGVPDVERLTLTGTRNIDGAGNAENNLITGNTGANVLKGGDGDDRLVGGDGDDTLNGGNGNDMLTGGPARTR